MRYALLVPCTCDFWYPSSLFLWVSGEPKVSVRVSVSRLCTKEELIERVGTFPLFVESKVRPVLQRLSVRVLPSLTLIDFIYQFSFTMDSFIFMTSRREPRHLSLKAHMSYSSACFKSAAFVPPSGPSTD